SDITGLIGQYAHGNEPSHHVAYLYAALGRPDKTQAYVERIRNEFYKNRPDGLIGNEDCGQMSSWYVFSALGFYPLHPFDAHYIAGIPAFEKTTIRLPGKDPVQIRWRRDGQSNQHYGLRINGVRSGSRFKLNPGDRLEFVPEGGGAIVQETETIAVNTLPPILPFVAEGQRSFSDSTRVILSAPQNLPVECTFDTSFKSGLRFQQPLVIREPLRIYFRLRSDGEPGSWLFADFAPRPKGFGLHLKSEYANAYAAGGPEALMDGLTGSRDFRDGLWQGYQGKDLDLELENQSGQIYKQVSIRFLQDQASWIMMPEEVRFEISDDGREFSLLGVAHHQVSKMTEGGVIQEFNMEINRPFRFIRILARNSGKLPEWHLGAGGTSWLFADEIRLK
ncbi:MAG TPA: glycoside hydrolase domain-containing protein, partial [Saprospiraceae bacterium]|nr:glycoside hydrolase domain-containing protein [Saprospiraceae bacterium]